MSTLGLTSALYSLLNLVPWSLMPGRMGQEGLGVGHVAASRTSPLHTNNQSDSLTTRCYGVYGCFSVDQPFLSLARPVNVFPLPPSVITPTLCLYTRTNPFRCQRLRVEAAWSVRGSHFRAGSKVKVLTHGYLEHGRKNWLKKMVSEYLSSEDLNVIVMDWLAGSGPPYTQAVANIRLIGAMLGHFVIGLQSAGLVNASQVHLVGHSLGAQLIGYTGHYMREQGVTLGRITGLDPAEPHFEGTEPLVRLDSGDADLVDVLHTDAGPIITGGLGVLQPAGHLDFYPNGGVTMPGCGAHLAESLAKEHGNIPYGLRRFIGCNHIRAYEYFTESINSRCPFLGIECSSWDAYVKGECWQCGDGAEGSRCARMGAHADVPYITNGTPGVHIHRQLPPLMPLEDLLEGDGISKKLYLITGPDDPFCLFHHRVSVVMSYTDEAQEQGGDIGVFYVTLFGRRATSPRIQLNPEEIFFEPGNVYTYMVGTGDLGHLEHATLEWGYVTAFYNPLTWRLLSLPKVFINRLHIESIEMQERYEFCGLDQLFESGWVRQLVWRPVCPDQEPPPGASILGSIINFDVGNTINDNIDAVNSGLNSLGNGQLISNIASSANQAARELMEDAKRRMDGVWFKKGLQHEKQSNIQLPNNELGSKTHSMDRLWYKERPHNDNNSNVLFPNSRLDGNKLSVLRVGSEEILQNDNNGNSDLPTNYLDISRDSQHSSYVSYSENPKHTDDATRRQEKVWFKKWPHRYQNINSIHLSKSNENINRNSHYSSPKNNNFHLPNTNVNINKNSHFSSPVFSSDDQVGNKDANLRVDEISSHKWHHKMKTRRKGRFWWWLW